MGGPWKRGAVVAVGVVAVAAVAAVVAQRKNTRLRLAYPAGDVVATRDIVYVAGSAHAKHRLDVFAPKDARGAPIVHFVHGGYWSGGDRNYYALVSGLYGTIGEALARRGIVTVIQSYRLSPEVALDGMLDDVIAAVKWTHAHGGEHGGDPQRLFLMGHSAGGHLVALVGTADEVATSRGFDPRLVRGTIALSAVWDIAAMADELSPKFNEDVTYRVFGRDRTKWPASSPGSRLHTGMAPFLIAIGDRDYDYMIPQADQARDKLTILGAPPAFIRMQDTDHRGVVLAFGTKDDPLSDPIAKFVGAR